MVFHTTKWLELELTKLKTVRVDPNCACVTFSLDSISYSINLQDVLDFLDSENFKTQYSVSREYVYVARQADESITTFSLIGCSLLSRNLPEVLTHFKVPKERKLFFIEAFQLRYDVRSLKLRYTMRVIRWVLSLIVWGVWCLASFLSSQTQQGTVLCSLISLWYTL